MSFADAFNTFAFVDNTTSEGIVKDARGLVCQSRSQFSQYLNEPCSSLSAWTVHTGGTSSIQQEVIGQGGTENPAGSNAFQLSTGSTQNSYCAANLTLPNLPTSYGIDLILALTNVTGHPQDAFQLTVQNTVDGKLLNMLFYEDMVSIADNNGVYHQLGNHDPIYACENWIEVKDNGDGTNTVTLYQGCQFISCVTITMPTGTNSGMVYFQQMSGANNLQTSEIMGLYIGATQLPDNGLLQGTAWTCPINAKGVNILFTVEDCSAELDLNEDFTASIIHNGTEIPLVLCDLGKVGEGIIDFTKYVRLFHKSVCPLTIAQNDTLAYKCHMLNGKLMAVLSVVMQPVSEY